MSVLPALLMPKTRLTREQLIEASEQLEIAGCARRGGGGAACRTRAAAGDAGGRLAQHPKFVICAAEQHSIDRSAEPLHWPPTPTRLPVAALSARIQQPTSFEFVINLRTAKASGLRSEFGSTQRYVPAR
jgi:hypothetical protein